MTLESFLLIAHIQTILSALVAIVSFVKFKSRDIVIRLIGLVFLVSFLANISALLFGKFPWLREFVNIPYVAYLLISFVVLSKVYRMNLGPVNRIWYVVAIVVFFSFAGVNLFFIQKTAPNSYTNILHSGMLIIYSLLYFYVLMRDLPSLYIHHIPMFWFNAGILIFHAGTFFLFSFLSYLVNIRKDDLIAYWSFHNMLSIIEHLIILIGLYYDLKFLKGEKLRPPHIGQILH